MTKLDKLACGCHDGACNLYALINSLAEAIKEVSPMELKKHPATPVIMGHLDYLAGNGIGPDQMYVDGFFEHLKAQEVTA